MKAPTIISKPLLSAKGQRYLSLDVLRGLTVCLMIVVNTPGSWGHIYAPFKHAPWHGFTPTDWVFPSFLFVVGNAMSFGLRKFKESERTEVLSKLFKRAGLIFLFGLLLTLFPFIYRDGEGQILVKDFSAVRIMGVLQRIALCYLFAGFIIHFCKIKTTYWVGAGILLSYWAVMFFYGDAADPYSLKGNFTLKFDALIIPAANLYKGFGLPFDPEGLFSTLPAVVNVLAGFWAGLFIQKETGLLRKTRMLRLAGALCVLLGLLWDVWFPINKPIWTSSFVVYSAGWSLIVLSGLIFLIEKMQISKWTYFFEVFGKNPLILFILSGVLIKTLSIIRVGGVPLSRWIYQNAFLSWNVDKTASLLFAISFMLTLWVVGYFMEKNKIFIKV
ncbi:acyltransferase family protein [Litoribacter populi]|uniref:acyltransferase family protein n=1 Tax=Litoribacter populi TaxID=2598460 RepID=UPI00117DC49F|nr:heparan-alpha-glucosaminide N-acetyltransferase domain-containing protein [Litoribacter populi]